MITLDDRRISKNFKYVDDTGLDGKDDGINTYMYLFYAGTQEKLDLKNKIMGINNSQPTNELTVESASFTKNR